MQPVDPQARMLQLLEAIEEEERAQTDLLVIIASGVARFRDDVGEMRTRIEKERKERGQVGTYDGFVEGLSLEADAE